MKKKEPQDKRFEHYPLHLQSKSKMSHLDTPDTIIYIRANDCGWLGLPKYFGHRPTIYKPLNQCLETVPLVGYLSIGRMPCQHNDALEKGHFGR